MYNILIVDDDYIFRAYIKDFIDYAKYDFIVCFEAENGQTALEIIRNNLVHVVITDMNMPLMNGVELINQTKLLDKDIVFIALSGFEDFDYVKESMRNGAIDYILKHRISEDYLINILVKAQEKLANTQVSHQSSSNILKAYQKDLTADFIKHLVLEGADDKKKTQQLMENLLISIDPTGITVLLIEIDDYKKVMKKWRTSREQKSFIDSVINICQGILDDMQPGIALHIENGRIAVLYSFGSEISENYFYERTNQIISRIKNSIKRLLNITCCIAVSSICNDIAKLDSYYNEAAEKMSLKFYSGNDNVFYNRLPENSETRHYPIDVSYIKQGFLNYRFDLIREEVQKLYHDFYTRQADREIVMAVSLELTSIAAATARNFFINLEELNFEDGLPHIKIQEADTFIQLKINICCLFEKLFSLIMQRKMPADYSEVTRKAILFFFSSYMNNISLDDVARVIGVNSAYLSRIFKRETGKGFVEYLNLFRIDIAKQMLAEGDESVKDVAYNTGFSSYNYFFKIFKEVTGLIPQEFRKDHNSIVNDGNLH